MTLAYHFVADTLRDGRPVPPDGEWLVHDGPVEMCSSGLHASRRAIDALDWAPGATLCRVEVDQVEREVTDKLVCRRRRILWRLDATEVLRRFARRCALDVIDLSDAPEVVVRYLKTGDESLRADARAAAMTAARAAARDPAMTTAMTAARAAARDAARDAAMDPARAAARAAAWAAARAATWAATWDPAWAAALVAARATQERRLVAMVAAERSKLS